MTSWDLSWEALRGVSATFDLPWEAESPVALTLAVVLTANGIAVPPPRPDSGHHPLHHEEGDLLAPAMTLVALTVAVRTAIATWNASRRTPSGERSAVDDHDFDKIRTSVEGLRDERLERIERKLDALRVDLVPGSGGEGGKGGRKQGGGGGGGGGAGASGGAGGTVYATTVIVPPALLGWLREANPELAAEFDPDGNDGERRAWLARVQQWLTTSAAQVPANVVANLLADLAQ